MAVVGRGCSPFAADICVVWRWPGRRALEWIAGWQVNSVRGTVSWGRGAFVALVVGTWVVCGFPSVGTGAAALVAPELAAACTIMGTPRPDLLRGTSGDDVICGMGGDDQLMGLGGNDSLFGDGGDDVLLGGAGHDLLRGAAGNDVEFGGRGNDRLRNWAGADRLNGGHGNDHLRGGRGSDVVNGGPGRDLASYEGHAAGVRASIGGGANDGRRGEGDDIGGDVEDLRGGPDNDTLVGSAEANRLFGSGGNDRLTGLAGNDLLDAGGGRDVLNGRDGAGFVDELTCGGGAGDRAIADMSDRVSSGCEDVVQNDRPTGIALTPVRVAENRPVGTRVGTLSAADPDPGDRHTFRLVAGTGSADNGSFRVDGTALETDAVFDFETKNRYAVRVRATDHEGSSFERSLTVTVTDTFENVPRWPSTTRSTPTRTPCWSCRRPARAVRRATTPTATAIR